MGNGTQGKGPDNNRRLAFLERQMTRLAAAASALAVEPGFVPVKNEDAVDTVLRLISQSAMAANSDNMLARIGDYVLEHYASSLVTGEDIAAGVIRILSGLELELRELRIQMVAAGHFLAGREGFTPVPDEGAVVALLRVVADLDEKVAVEPDAADQIAALTGEISSLKFKLAAQKGQATRARSEVSVLKLERSPVSRPVVPMEEPRMRAVIEEALDAGEVEIVFSDGRVEILELAPVRVLGDAWQRGGGRLMLRPAVELEPGDMDRPEVAVAGFGLFAGGEQIAWRALPEAVKVPRNGRVLLENTIAF